MTPSITRFAGDPTRCLICNSPEVTAGRNIVTVSVEDGGGTNVTEHYCGKCFAEVQAREAIVRAAEHEKMPASFADGSAFEQMRAELTPVIERALPEELARAAEFLDLIAPDLPVPLPDDLKAFADQHRPATGVP